MNYLPNGVVVFNDIFELYYDLFNEIGVSVGPNQYLYDQDTQTVIKFNEKYIKASVNGQPVYPGRNDVVFEPQKNYALMCTMFGYYLDKSQNTEDGDILQGYVAHYIDDNQTKDKQRIVVKTIGRGEICSDFYYNIYLAYIDCIFRVAGYNVDLHNFDVVLTD